jgi:uncharacterized protein YjiS (DUF1127 family)
MKSKRTTVLNLAALSNEELDDLIAAGFEDARRERYARSARFWLGSLE